MPHWPPAYDEQDAGLMNRMNACLNVYEAFQGLHSADNVVEWGRYNQEALKVIGAVRKMEKELTQ